MGFLYSAERTDGQYQLEVAVKLMRGGPRDPYAGERFRTERQVLASLKHPHIASLLDGGLAPDGTPYLVMELVDGVPITEWCRGHGLSVEARLALFRVVCDAVQHAHQALVVHRDLKPDNILVSRAGDVKLLDFGIAKLLEPEAWGIERDGDAHGDEGPHARVRRTRAVAPRTHHHGHGRLRPGRAALRAAHRREAPPPGVPHDPRTQRAPLRRRRLPAKRSGRAGGPPNGGSCGAGSAATWTASS